MLKIVNCPRIGVEDWSGNGPVVQYDTWTEPAMTVRAFGQERLMYETLDAQDHYVYHDLADGWLDRPLSQMLNIDKFTAKLQPQANNRENQYLCVANKSQAIIDLYQIAP